MATPAAVNPSEMGTDLPGPVAMPGAVVGAGQVRMAGAMPGRGGKRRSAGMDFDDEDGEGPSKFSRQTFSIVSNLSEQTNQTTHAPCPFVIFSIVCPCLSAVPQRLCHFKTSLMFCCPQLMVSFQFMFF
ncbi:aryl hydrocarbon receptor nuclear translocator 2-like [Garra rufa]|uniref:aryl hydrocarbon receptor nuclear translocator 2-like n=1 Tax=Garra rufa TaxID=137080 RepID=UPI003CCEC4E8